MQTKVIRFITAVAAVLSLAAIAGQAVQNDEAAQVAVVAGDSAWGANQPRHGSE